MRIVRYQYKTEALTYGWLLENKVGPIVGNIFAEYRRQEVALPVESVRLLAPVQPTKIVCIGRNYAEHAKEHEVDVPKVPLLFLKPPSSILNPGETIILAAAIAAGGT